MAWVRWRTKRSRVRNTTAAACWFALLRATTRMVGRWAASQIASASAMSFFWRLTHGFTYAGAISFTVWPSLAISRPQSIHLSSIAGCDTHKAEQWLWSLAVRVGRFSCRVVAVRLLFEPPNFHRGLGAAGRDEQEKENVCHRGFLSRIAASDSEWARGDKVTRTRCCW